MSIFVDVLVELISTDKYSNCQLNQYIYKYCCLGIVNSKATWKLNDIIHVQIIREIFSEQFDVFLIKSLPGRRRLRAPRKLILLHPVKKDQYDKFITYIRDAKWYWFQSVIMPLIDIQTNIEPISKESHSS